MKSFFLFLGSLALLTPLSVASAEPSSADNFRLLKAYIQNTAEQDFTSTTNLGFSIKVEGDRFRPSFNIQESVALDIVKQGKKFSVGSDETVQFSFDNAPKSAYKSDFFPVLGKATIKGNAILDFEGMHFQGKMSTVDLSLDDKSSPAGKKVAEGLAEFYDFVSEKWVEINIGALTKEYPEAFSDFDQIKQDLQDALAQKQFLDFVQALVDQGKITITESSAGNFTVSIPANLIEQAPSIDFKDDAVVLQFAVSNGVVKTFSMNESVVSDGAEISLVVQANFTPNAVAVAFPQLAPADLELTKIARMLLEFAKDQNKKYGSSYYNSNNTLYQSQYTFEDNLQSELKFDRALTRAERKYIAKATKVKEIKDSLGYLFTSTGQDAAIKKYLEGKSLSKELTTDEVLAVVEIFREVSPEVRQSFTDCAEISDQTYCVEKLGHDLAGVDSSFVFPYAEETPLSLGMLLNGIAHFLNAERLTKEQFRF